MTGTALPYSGEVSRKALHLLAMAMPVAMLYVPRIPAIVILSVLALSAVSADLLRSRYDVFGTWIDGVFGFMMRPTERGRDRERTLNGATWVMVTAALLLIVFPPQYAAPGMVIAMIADAGAALVGRKIGRHRWPGSSRTVEGTMAFLATGLVAAMFFPWIALPHRIAALVAAAVVELLPLRINDNLLLPFAAAAVLWGLGGAPPLW